MVDGKDVPYELHYARKMTHYLTLRQPSASPVLQTAIRAQRTFHSDFSFLSPFLFLISKPLTYLLRYLWSDFRRWEIPRSSYPATKPGYLQWRSFLKKRQADLAAAICLGCNYAPDEAEEVARLIRKEDLRTNEETAVLEDVACLVFLNGKFLASLHISPVYIYHQDKYDSMRMEKTA